MGQIPRFQASPEGVPSGAGTNVKMPTLDDPERAMAQLGQNAEKIGIYFAEAQIKTDTIKHRSDFERYISDYSRTFPLEAEVRGTDDIKLFDERVKAYRDSTMVGIRNGKTRQLVDAEMNEIEQRYRVHTLQTLRAKQVSIGQGEMAQNLFNYRRGASLAQTDGDKDRIRGMAFADINDYVRTGIIEAEEGAKVKLQFDAGVASDHVLALLNAGDYDGAREAANHPALPADQKISLGRKIDSRQEVDINKRNAEERRQEIAAEKADRQMKEDNALVASEMVWDRKWGVAEVNKLAGERKLKEPDYNALRRLVESRRDAKDDPMTRTELALKVATRAPVGEIYRDVVKAVGVGLLSGDTGAAFIEKAGSQEFTDALRYLNDALAPGPFEPPGPLHDRLALAVKTLLDETRRGRANPLEAASNIVSRTAQDTVIPRYLIKPKTWPAGREIVYSDPDIDFLIKRAGEHAISSAATLADWEAYSMLVRGYEDYKRMQAIDQKDAKAKKSRR